MPPRPCRRAPRRALTLLEVLMATALLAGLVAMCAQILGATSRMSATDAAKDDLAEDIRRIVAAIEGDLTVSGWHLADRSDADIPAAAATPESAATALAYDPAAGGWNHQGLYQGAVPPGSAQAFATADGSPCDRNRRYYPFVVQQAPAIAGPSAAQLAGLGHAANPAYVHRYDWSHTHRPQAMRGPGPMPAELPGTADDALATGLDPQLDAISFHARSRELVFLRITADGWAADPGQLSSRAGAFAGTIQQWRAAAAQAVAQPGSAADKQARESLGILFASGWEAMPTQPNLLTYRTSAAGAEQRVYGASMDGAYIESLASGDVMVRPKWETMALRTDAGGAVLDPARNGTSANLREYQYAVVPSPVGLGRLVRAYSATLGGPAAPDRGQGVQPGQWIAYSDPAAGGSGKAMIIDEVLSDNVVRIAFSTRRHDAGMPINQVAVRIWLARRALGIDGQDTLIRRIFVTDIVLGARPSTTEQAFDEEALGPAVAPAW